MIKAKHLFAIPLLYSIQCFASDKKEQRDWSVSIDINAGFPFGEFKNSDGDGLKNNNIGQGLGISVSYRALGGDSIRLAGGWTNFTGSNNSFNDSHTRADYNISYIALDYIHNESNYYVGGGLTNAFVKQALTTYTPFGPFGEVGNTSTHRANGKFGGRLFVGKEIKPWLALETRLNAIQYNGGLKQSSKLSTLTWVGVEARFTF
jgi:hypothetical protein